MGCPAASHRGPLRQGRERQDSACPTAIDVPRGARHPGVAELRAALPLRVLDGGTSVAEMAQSRSAAFAGTPDTFGGFRDVRTEADLHGLRVSAANGFAVTPAGPGEFRCQPVPPPPPPPPPPP